MGDGSWFIFDSNFSDSQAFAGIFDPVSQELDPRRILNLTSAHTHTHTHTHTYWHTTYTHIYIYTLAHPHTHTLSGYAAVLIRSVMKCEMFENKI